MEYQPPATPTEPEKSVLYVTDVDIDIARLIVRIDKIDGRNTPEATLKVANAKSATDQ